MIKKFISILTLINLNLIRFADHLYRHISGKPDPKTSSITPYIYLSGQYGHRAIPYLQKLGVKGVVNMRESEINPAVKNYFQVLHLPTPDYHAPTISQLKVGVAFIARIINEKGKVYIHCRAGEGRGPTMAAAYLISTGLTVQDALNLIRNVRIFINPTPVQVRQLEKFATVWENRSKL